MSEVAELLSVWKMLLVVLERQLVWIRESRVDEFALPHLFPLHCEL